MEAVERIAVIGAGSLRCAAPVLASIAGLSWPAGTELRLCDVHLEALDLFDRLARMLASQTGADLRISAGSDIGEAMDEATVVVLAFGLGPAKDEWRRWIAESSILDDSGREATLARCILLHLVFEQVNEYLGTQGKEVRVINLVRPVDLTSNLLAWEASHIEWPEQIGEDERIPAAHQALRWIRGDDYLHGQIEAGKTSPLTEALKAVPPSTENRFNANAVKRWMDELQGFSEDATARLLRFHL